MCQRLYVATRARLPAVKRSQSAPYLEIAEVQSGRAPAFFGADRPFVYLAGAHVECGCGFPAVAAAPDSSPSRLDDADVRSMQALAEHLREACRGHSTVELYLCWVHEQAEALATRRTATLDELRQPGFRLRHRELLTVGSGPPHKRRQGAKGR